MISKEVNLNEFVKNQPDYICVLPDKNEIHGEVRNVIIKIQGINATVDSVRLVVKMPIKIHIADEPRDLKPKAIHLWYGKAQTLLCLLTHKPEQLNLVYWHDNKTKLYKGKGLKNETIIFKANKGRKAFTVQIENVIETELQRLATF